MTSAPNERRVANVSAHIYRAVFLGLTLLARGAFGQLQISLAAPPQRVFCGESRAIELKCRNSASVALHSEIRARLFLASSTVAASLGETPWKSLDLLPNQTTLDHAFINFPSVKTCSRFLLQWLDSHDRVVGDTEIWVCPTNLLATLKRFSPVKPVGILDPDRILTTLLARAGIETANLDEREVDSFEGRLAIFGFFRAPLDFQNGFSDRVTRLARRGVGIVWIHPASLDPELHQDFYRVPFGSGAVVVAEAGIVASLTDNPTAQLNLIRLVELALKPEPERLPGPSHPPF